MRAKALLRHKHVCLRRCRYGLMMFYTTDQYIGQSLDRYGDFSQGEMDLLAEYLSPGDCVVDVGAHVGVHTLFFAETVGPGGKVLCFEPQRGLFHLLCGNLALNGHRHVFPQNTAVGAESGCLSVPQFDFAISSNFAGLSLDRESEGDAVPVMALDEMDLGRCELIKIDVEGMEKSVLQGACETIGRCRPVLYVENDRNEQAAALIEQLFSMDYRLFWHLPPLFDPDNFLGNSDNIFGDLISANMLGLHRGESERIPSSLRQVRSAADTWDAVG